MISGLYDVNPALAGQVNNLVTDASTYGETYQYFNGLDVTVNVRTRGGLNIQGGTSTGQTVSDACDVRANLPELNLTLGPGLAGSMVSTTSPYCHVAYGVLTQLRGLASYTIPKVDVQVSGVMQSKPGALLAANYAFPAAEIAAALGRPVAGNPQNVTINLLQPGSRYGDRINQLDFRAAKVLTVWRDALNDRGRRLQHAQLWRRAVIQQHLRAQQSQSVAAADFGPYGPNGRISAELTF